MKGNSPSFTLTLIRLFIFCFYLCFPSSSIFIFDYYWFLFTFPLNLPALAVPPYRPLHPQKIASVSIVPVLSSWLFSLLLQLSSPPSGGRGEHAGLQWAACHGGAEENRSPGQTEAAEEGCPSESHPAPSSSPAASQTLPQLPRGQSLQSGPQQDSRDRCFALREGSILAQWYHKGIGFEVTEQMQNMWFDITHKHKRM